MKIEIKQTASWKKWLGLSLFVGLVAVAAANVSGEGTKTISAKHLRFQTVEQGPLDIYSTAYGEFASAQERLLTAPAQGKVAEVKIRPGTQVTPNTVVLRLSNPRLEQALNDARGELAQQRAQREAFKYEQQSARLDYQGRIANIEAEIERAELELSVNTDLLVLGVASKIDLKRTKLTVKQQSKRLQFEQDKFQQFLEMQRYQLAQRDITIEQKESQVRLLEKQLDDMQVKAGLHGSLQALEVELGESVQLGQSLARVGSNQDLIARLRLPQYQTDQIDINAPVIIDTQKGKVAAHISRIESVVSNGAVLAEAIVDEQLTSNARPSLSISAQVFFEHNPNAVFVEQTPGLRPRSKQSVFVLTAETRLEKREVILGELSQQKLIVLQGLAPGDQIVSSDTNQFSEFNELSLTN